jgi:hypothetical protein
MQLKGALPPPDDFRQVGCEGADDVPHCLKTKQRITLQRGMRTSGDALPPGGIRQAQEESREAMASERTGRLTCRIFSSFTNTSI